MANFLLALLLLLLSTATASALVRVNIDCGASDPYTDALGIKWDTDDPYTTAGENHAVKSPNSVSKPLQTLRVFTSGKPKKKNCYTVPVDAGGLVRIRVSFNYGDYDGKSSAPTFQLILDGNDWTSIETSADDEVFYEVMYVVNGGSVSVCVAQTAPEQLPFVSALQVWQLEAEMYAQFEPSPSSALILATRFAFAATSVRYPDDAFDRMWHAAEASDPMVLLKSDAASITINATDQPPEEVLRTAVASSSTNKSIILPMGLASDQALLICVNLYFAETTELGTDDTRSFAIFVDGRQLSDPIVPKYAVAREYYISNLNASGSNEFSLQATEGSTLPPMINAMEVFVVSETLNNRTNAGDVAGLAELVEGFDELKEWGGDPCLPPAYAWEWVGCSSDDAPRVTALNLDGYGLTGELPDFSSLHALETIDLRNNSIGGAIPEFLGKLPNLKELNLADNSFSGPIPSSLSSNKNIKLVTSGNPNLCAYGQSCKVLSSPASSPPGPGKPKDSNADVKRSSLGSFLVMIVLYFLGIVA